MNETPDAVRAENAVTVVNAEVDEREGHFLEEE